MRGEDQRLTEHLKAIFAEIERLRLVYSHAIDQLETYTLPNLSPHSATRWFNMYLRVVDIGIQLRRGEVRHCSTQQFKFPCMHETGTKGAVHSGLSIDDGNAIYQQMESRKLVSENRLDRWFIKMDGLDRDDIGLLDKRVTRCLESFRRQDSIFYDRIEIMGEDPHEEMMVLGGHGATDSRVLAKATRTCFGPSKCSCEEDAHPWESFSLTSGDPLSQKPLVTNANSSTKSEQLEDMGIIDIKRQMGFQQLSYEDAQENVVTLARDSSRSAGHLNSFGKNTTATVGLHAPLSARSIYQKKCGEIGLEAKPSIHALLAVNNGAHHLDLSGIGFHSAHDLQDLVDIFSIPGLPPVKELNVSNGFFNAAAFDVLCELLRLPLLRQNVKQLSLRGIAVPRSADIAVLVRLLTGDSSSIRSLPALDSLQTLDLSYNTLWHEGAEHLRPLLASLPGLEHLFLESCFPKIVSSFNPPSSASDQKVMEDNVRLALMDVSNRLQCLDFGSNCIATESRWLDAIFAPGSTTQKLYLRGITSISRCTTEIVEDDWKVSETWDLQQVETLTWSSSSVYTNKLLDALSAELQGGFAQLKHLDLEVNDASWRDRESNNVDRHIADTIAHIADYGVMQSCRICYYRQNGTISLGVYVSMKKLLEDGLHECEVLALRIPHLCLGSSAICDLLSSAVVPKMWKLTLAIGIVPENEEALTSGSCFPQMQSMRELVLELHTTVTSEATAVALAHQLKTSWLKPHASTDFVDDVKQDVDLVDGNVARSFDLLEQVKANKRIYRCRFYVTSPSQQS
uniref:Uncharacterized protein n=1 Tax=Peronospora matthiolae TaxID=2874970 RepID=A0AAV1UWK8_9STRA